MRRFVALFALSILVISALACGSDVTPQPAVITSPTPVVEQPQTAESTTAPDQPQTAEPTVAPTSPLAMAKLGETVELAGMSLSAVQVSDPATPGILYQAEAGKRLVAVEIILGNVSSAETISSNALYFTLVDAEGFTYQADLGGIDNQIELSDLAQGEKKKGWIAFKVPEGSVLASIKFQPGMFTDVVLQVGLMP